MYKSRYYVLTLLVGSLYLMTTHCSNNIHDFEPSEDILVSSLGQDPETLDPAEAGDTLSVAILGNIYGRAYQFFLFR